MEEGKSLSALIAAHVADNNARTYTSLPAVVVRVHGAGATQQVDVQPSVSPVLRTGVTRDLPVIGGVPLIYPASLTSSFTFPINIGDTVLLVFCQSDIENFKLGNGRPLGAKTARKQSMADAVAVPGLFPFNKARNNPSHRQLPHNTMDAVITHNIGSGGECEVRLKENGDVKVTSPTTVEIVCKDAKLTASASITLKAATMVVDVPNTTWTGSLSQTGSYTQSGNYTLTGNFTHTGNYTLGGKLMNNHVHSGVTAGPSNTGVNV